VQTALQGIEAGIAEDADDVDNSGEVAGNGFGHAVGEWGRVASGSSGVGGVNGGEALRLIKSKIPTYSSVFGC
jgi:hypothetical protein